MVKSLIHFYSKKISKFHWILFISIGFILSFIDSVFLSLLYPFINFIFFDETFQVYNNIIPQIVINYVNIILENHLILIFIIIVISKSFINFIEIYYSVYIQQRFELYNRLDIFKTFLGNSPKDILLLDQGKSNNVLLNQINELKIGFRQFTIFIRRFSYLIIYFIVFGILFGLLGVLIFSSIVIIPLFLSKIFNSTRSLSKIKSSNDDKLGNNIFESILFLKYLISTDLTLKYEKIIEKNLIKLVNVSIKLGRNDALIKSVREPSFLALVSIMFLLKSKFNFESEDLILVSLLSYRVSNYSFEFYSFFNEFLKSYGPYKNYLLLQNSFKKAKNFQKEIHKITSIEFKEFSLTPFNRRLNFKINFTINQKDKILLIGESGSGKSSVINTLLKFNEKYNGKLLFNGIDIKQINSKSIRSQIGFVSQEPIIFNDSLYNNLTLWDEYTLDNEKRIISLLNKFKLEKLISEIFNSNINYKEKLSGGEKQRINLIREIYKNPNILFLDEITSALDKESKKIIFDYLRKTHITFIFITHDDDAIKSFTQKIKIQNK